MNYTSCKKHISQPSPKIPVSHIRQIEDSRTKYLLPLLDLQLAKLLRQLRPRRKHRRAVRRLVHDVDDTRGVVGGAVLGQEGLDLFARGGDVVGF